MNDIVNYFVNLPFIEWIAVLTAMAYVIFAAKENIWCWPMAVISTVIYSVIFYDVYLWMDSVLQLYYLVMAFYGWYCWQASRSNTSPDSDNKPLIAIHSWAFNKHIYWISCLAVISLVVGWLMAKYTPTHFPYLDAATTVYSVFATYLVTQKVLENWLYWVVIDAVSIYLYLEKGLMPTVFLFCLYVIWAVYGYFHWLNVSRKHQSLTDAYS